MAVFKRSLKIDRAIAFNSGRRVYASDRIVTRFWMAVKLQMINL
jgi:hypothetical protein